MSDGEYKPPPVVRKTKKSSYRPLSKLNQDHLTELKRVDKPEYTSRVFFYNSVTKHKLNSDVNVWFKDHEHTMRVINRQQRAACRVLAKVQQDKHRIRRALYKRQQNEMRDEMKRLDKEMMQKSVVQKFRRNAFQKMTKRGQEDESLAGKRLEEQRQRHQQVGEDEQEEEKEKEDGAEGGGGGGRGGGGGKKPNPPPLVMLTAVATHYAIVAKSEMEALRDNNDHQGLLTVPGSDGSASANKPSIASKVEDSSLADSSEGSSGPQSKESSSTDAVLLRNADQTTAENSPKPARQKSVKISVSKQTDLDVIPEVASPTLSMRSGSPPTEERVFGKGEEAGNAEKEDTISVGETSSSMNSRVIEVSKRRPGSPSSVTSRTRKIAYAAPPQNAAPTPINPHRTQNPQSHHQKRVSGDQSSSVANTSSERSVFNPQVPLPSLSKNPPPSSQNVSGDSNQTSKRGDHDPLGKEGLWARASDSPHVPSREQAVDDAVCLLSLDAEEEEEEDGRGVGLKAPKSLAARIRLERREEARRRAEVLDNEPLTQYYRSCRGNLQPLMSEPERRQWTVPSGKREYWRTKLLKQEHGKEVDRKGNIEKFFTDLFTRKLGEEKPAPQGSDTDEGNHLEKLLKRMRAQSQVVGPGAGLEVDKNSVDQLTKCQYLRVYDWDSRDRRRREGEDSGQEERLTSWGAAENSLKAGFLALDLTH